MVDLKKIDKQLIHATMLHIQRSGVEPEELSLEDAELAMKLMDTQLSNVIENDFGYAQHVALGMRMYKAMMELMVIAKGTSYVENKEVKIVPKIQEIQRAHDILDIIIHKMIEGTWIVVSKESQHFIISSHNVLCWILGHEEGKVFIENMVGTEAELAANGITFFDPEQEKGLDSHEI